MSEADIEAAVERDVLQLRKFVLAQAETKAKNRVIRRILALRQVYTEAELARPFAVPRLVYRPDIAEANLRLEQHGPAGEIVAGDETADSDGGLLETSAGERPEERTAESSPEEASDRVVAASPPPAPTVVGSGVTTTPTVPESPAEDDAASAPDDLEPTEGEVWTPNTILPPDPPKVDPEMPGGGRFSELAGTEQGRQALEDIATNSKAKARREAAQAWLDYGRAIEAAS